MTGKPGVLQSMGLQKVGYDLETEQQRRPSLHSSVMTIPRSISSLCRTLSVMPSHMFTFCFNSEIFEFSRGLTGISIPIKA